MQIKYTDEELQHSYYIGPGPGNRWRSSTGNKGRFGTAPKEYGRGDFEINPRNKYVADVTYKRRYDENTGEKLAPREDGDYETYGHGTYYSPAGLKRLAYEESVNNGRSRKNKLDEDAVKDTERWIRDDWDNVEGLVKGGTELSRTISRVAESPMFTKPKNMPRLDLSHLSDSELNNILNRERMERSYNDYFNQPQEKANKGADFVKGAAKVLTTAGEMSLTGLQIARIIKGFF